MPSLGSILSVASTALRTQQEAINVTAHNIANASTEGYSKQRPVLSQLPPQRTPTGIFGSGVVVSDVQRIRAGHLDSAYRAESGEYREQEVRSGILGQLEIILSEPGEGGLSTTLDQFFSAWSSLATNPTSTSARGAVREQGSLLSGQMKSLAADLDILRQDTEARLLSSVDRVNDLAVSIARLNREITASESSGETAGDLRDARDRAIDEMATLIPVQVMERENGGVGILTSGVGLVDGANHGALEVRLSGGTVELGLQGHSSSLTDLGARIGGMIQVLNNDLPAVRASLDELAEALVTEINILHQTGTNPDGDTGVEFFDSTGVTASTIGLSAAVAASASAVSAGTGGAAGEYRAGTNDIALALAGFRDAPNGSLGVSFATHFRKLATDVGFSVRSSLDSVEVHQTLSEQADVRRQSFSGVSTDEELVKLIEFQTAYSAAARVITVADELLDTLLRM